MATMTQRATYALDPNTTQAIKTLARRWATSQAEVIRRSIKRAAAEAAASPTMTPAEVIAHYRKYPPARSWAQTQSVIETLRRERRANDRARSRKLAAR